MSTMKQTITVGGLTVSILTPSSNQQTRVGGGVCPGCNAIHVIATGQNLDVVAVLGATKSVCSTIELKMRPAELAEIAKFLGELAAAHADGESGATQPTPRGCS